MRYLDTFTGKLNFKKIAAWYLVLGIITGIAAVSFLGYTYREKIAFAYEFQAIEEQIERDQISASQDLQSKLALFASRYQNIYDILVLDDSNDITYSAKKSDLAVSNTFTLTSRGNGKHNVLVLSENPNIGFKVVEDNEMAFFSLFDDRANEYHSEYKSETFFEPGFHQKTVYTLSYLTNEHTCERVFFIQNNTPIDNGLVSLKIVAAAAALFFMLYWVLLALWVYENARKAKLNAPLWGIITLFTNLAGLFIFLIYRQNGIICKSCGRLQSKGNLYCSNCGSKILESCSYCGRMIGNDDKYCPYCGKAIEKSE